MIFKVGFSKDTHNLIDGNKIILGGINIPCDKGVQAYSDGDVIFHSLAESIFGALGLEDLGQNYNQKTMEENFDSSTMVIEANKILSERGFKISNIDLLIELDSPKLTDWKIKIKENISNVLNIEIDKISVKATTTEGNFTNIITSYSNVLIYKEEGK
ncbi:2-C-methyl-D-erythritol 2,4-cyclodiphosphate synthase [Spiroplasma monobiae]|uniref:2-C-methyl-D-erythritol 2,4-cyclodiphosphate synthase n=1 Tax=Spiroplasma monobiae MQ-1 TaxID=1336748 RepID=A0A2K9LZ46_SPISQ|nr:2-C-methyl-D-erythritol 2,4-cyclodiphosphate synthase [Spiroplasma monobiae]AUM63034.1 2-C-methyl-D-erythritol 2,4-cyclodiphosphate synthase [Spiroplasma monobiae MQ-1]